MREGNDRTSIEATCAQVRSGEVRPSDVLACAVERIEKDNNKLNAFLSVTTAYANQAATALDALQATYPTGLGTLAGATVSIKDLIDTDFAATTYGSTLYKNHTPEQSAEVVQRLEKAHALIVGKTNLHEFAFGVTNENPHYGNANHPIDPSRITGGSSGGSAASVRAGMCLASVGTDTGGSVRIPASLCGVVGYKPTHGKIPVTGVFPLAPSLDHIGPITNTVADAALMFDVMADSKGDTDTQLYRALRERPLKHAIRVKVPANLIERFATDEVGAWFERTLSKLKEMSYVCAVETVELPIDEIARHQSNIMSAEARFIHRYSFAETPEAYGNDVRERLDLSKDVSTNDYIESLQFKATFAQRLNDMLNTGEVMLLPTTPLVATEQGLESIRVRDKDERIRSLMTRFTNPWNLSGLPAISIPGGMIRQLPIGLQCVAQTNEDAYLLRVSSMFESALQQM